MSRISAKKGFLASVSPPEARKWQKVNKSEDPFQESVVILQH